ncbi:hypothetical protein PEE19_04420 [Ralstonia solanacearum]
MPAVSALANTSWVPACRASVFSAASSGSAGMSMTMRGCAMAVLANSAARGTGVPVGDVDSL